MLMIRLLLNPPSDLLASAKGISATSPAVLIHWRILLNLLLQITRHPREGFRRIGGSYDIPPLSYTGSDSGGEEEVVPTELDMFKNF